MVEIWHPGPGHRHGDTIAWVEQEEVLFDAMALTRKSMGPVFGYVFIYEHCLHFDVSRAYDEAKGIKNPRIWTAERDKEMWGRCRGEF